MLFTKDKPLTRVFEIEAVQQKQAEVMQAREELDAAKAAATHINRVLNGYEPGDVLECRIAQPEADLRWARAERDLIPIEADHRRVVQAEQERIRQDREAGKRALVRRAYEACEDARRVFKELDAYELDTATLTDLARGRATWRDFVPDKGCEGKYDRWVTARRADGDL